MMKNALRQDSKGSSLQFEIFQYAVVAAAYIISRLSRNEVKHVRNVLLFGSVARFAASEDSDVDIFVDVSAPKKFQLGLRAELNKSADQFYLTNDALEFKSKGIDNELSIKVGKLEEWEDVAQSISSHGIILYGKQTVKPPGTGAYSIISWEKPGKSKGALLNKIYGYKAGKKRYPGLLEKNKGIKLGKAVIMVPAHDRDVFIDAMEKYRINYSRRDVWE